MKPNVILFYADTLAKEYLGCYGGKVPTPNIDRIASEGIRLECAQPNSPLCSPARYNLLTGRYASRCRSFQDLYTPHDPIFFRWNVYLKEEEDTLARAFGRSGYATGMVGKWHLGEPALERFGPDDAAANPASLAKVCRNYDRCRQYVKRIAGFDYVESLFTNNEMAIPMPADMTCQHNQHWITQGAVRFIEAHADQPFFLMATPNLPHPPSVLDTLESGSTLTPAGLLPGIPDVQPSYESILRRLEQLGFARDCPRDSAEWQRKDRAAAVMWLDDGVGAVLSALDRLGLADRTILAFTTDHLHRGKMTCYRQFLPMFIRWPAVLPGGQSRRALVSHVDLVATLTELAGLDDAGQVGQDGKSFASVLRGGDDGWRNEVLTEVTYTRGLMTEDWNYVAVRFPANIARQAALARTQELSQEGLERHTIRYEADEFFPHYFQADQLYDMRRDGEEQQNLAGDPACSGALEDMRRRLRRKLSQFGHAFGELAPAPTDGQPFVRRGEHNEIHFCQKCAHVEFSRAPAQCPVCAAESAYRRQDDLFYCGEEKWAEGVQLQPPRLVLGQHAGQMILNISNPGHPMKAEQDNYIRFYDVYRNDEFVRRIEFAPGQKPAGRVRLEAASGSALVVAFNPYYGHYQRELVFPPA